MRRCGSPSTTTSVPQIALPIWSEALVVETAERIGSDLEPLQQEPEQKRTDADPRHAKLGELTQARFFSGPYRIFVGPRATYSRMADASNKKIG